MILDRPPLARLRGQAARARKEWPSWVSARSASTQLADPTKPVGKRYNLSSRDLVSPTGDSRARNRQSRRVSRSAPENPVRRDQASHSRSSSDTADAQNIPWQKNHPCAGSHAPRFPMSKTGRGHRMYPQSKRPRSGSRYLSGAQPGFPSTLHAVRDRHLANSLSGNAVHGPSPGETARKNHPRSAGHPGGTPMLSGHQPRLGQYNTGVSEERLSSIGYPGRESGKPRLCRSSRMLITRYRMPH